jgi:predicted secreted protein
VWLVDLAKLVSKGKLMKKQILGLHAIGLFAIGLNAGTATIVGTAKMEVDPEFIEFSIDITSTCFPTKDKLTKAHDDVIANLQAHLNARIDESSKYNSVRIDGGFVNPYSKTLKNGDEVCINTYQKTTRIDITTDNFINFSNLFGKINHDVDEALFGKGGEHAHSESIKASITTPKSNITDETRKKYELKAKTKAFENAKQQFLAIYEGEVCLDEVCLKKSSPVTKHNANNTYAMNAFMAEKGDHHIEITDICAQVVITGSHKFVFSYPDKDCRPFKKQKTDEDQEQESFGEED